MNHLENKNTDTEGINASQIKDSGFSNFKYLVVGILFGIIFVKAEIKNTSDLLVNVGAGAVVQKDLASAKKLIQNQLEEMKKVHEKMVNEIEKMARRAAEIEEEIQKLMPQQNS